MERRRRRRFLKNPSKEEKLTPEKNKESPKDIFKAKLERVCVYIETKFVSRLDGALLAGLSLEEFQNHLEKGSLTGFEARILRAESIRDLELLSRTLKGDQNARWALERLSPEKFSRPSVTERIKDQEEEKSNRSKETYVDDEDEFEDYDSEIDGLGEFIDSEDDSS